MADALAWPIPQVGNRLPRGGTVQPPLQVLSTDHPHNLHIDHMRGQMIDIGGQTGCDLTGPRRVSYNLEQARRVND